MSGEKQDVSEPLIGSIGRGLIGTVCGGFILAFVINTYEERGQRADNAANTAQSATLNIVELDARLRRVEDENRTLRENLSSLEKRIGKDEQRISNIETSLSVQHQVFKDDIREIKDFIVEERRHRETLGHD